MGVEEGERDSGNGGLRGEESVQNFSSASMMRVFVKLVKRSMTCATACSPCTLLSRVRTFSVPFCCSFSPTTASGGRSAEQPTAGGHAVSATAGDGP